MKLRIKFLHLRKLLLPLRTNCMGNGCVNPYYKVIKTTDKLYIKQLGYSKMILGPFTMQDIKLYLSLYVHIQRCGQSWISTVLYLWLSQTVPPAGI